VVLIDRLMGRGSLKAIDVAGEGDISPVFELWVGLGLVGYSC